MREWPQNLAPRVLPTFANKCQKGATVEPDGVRLRGRVDGPARAAVCRRGWAQLKRRMIRWA